MNFNIDNSSMNRNNFSLQCSVETNIHEVEAGTGMEGERGGGGGDENRKVSIPKNKYNMNIKNKTKTRQGKSKGRACSQDDVGLHDQGKRL